MKIDEIISQFGAAVFLDKQTDMLITWNGEIQFEVFSGRFDGNYDHIDTFYKMVKTLNAATLAAQSWLEEHTQFNPGP